MKLNIKTLQNLFTKNTKTSYKYIFFYSLIRILKAEHYVKEEITYKEIIKEMFLISWLPCFQFNLKFREHDKDYIKKRLQKYMKNKSEDLKKNKPNKNIIEKINKSIIEVLENKKDLETLEKNLLHEVVPRLIRPFYKRTIGIPEAGPNGWYTNYEKILIDDYEKVQPLYLINIKDRKITLNDKWINYIKDNYIFLELLVLNKWYGYMQVQNINTPALYEKLKFPDPQRGSLEKQKKFWKQVIKNNEVRCIFSKEKLTENNFAIDHFICWNFLPIDTEWNLIPILEKENSKKSNKIPNENHIIDFVDFKIKSFEFAKEHHKKYGDYLTKFEDFVKCSFDYSKEKEFKKKYIEEVTSLANIAKKEGFEEFNE